MIRRQRPLPQRTGPVGRAALAGALVVIGMATAACGSSPSTIPVAATSPAGSGTPSATATATAAPAPQASAKATAGGPEQAPKAVSKLLPKQVSSAQQKITVGDHSLVAKTNGASISVYPSPTSTSARWTLKNPLPSGAPLVFLVQERRADRLRVLVPVRPNESQGWIRASDVALSQHDYRIVVSVGRHTLSLYRAGKVAMQVPVGLGTGSTPTPGGVFYTKELLQPNDPAGAYGPYAYGLSGYSTVLENFGGGDGEIGIHGTNDPASLGKNVSHGCIRMSNDNITKLAGMLPLGVPVQIVR